MGALTRGHVSAEVHVLRHNGHLLRESTFILSQFPPRVKTPRAFLANQRIIAENAQFTGIAAGQGSVLLPDYYI